MCKNNMASKMMVVFGFFMFYFNSPFDFFFDDDEGMVAYAQTPQTWSMLNADLTGPSVSWKPEWETTLGQAKAALDQSTYGCLEVSGVEDVNRFGIGNTELRAAGGQEPLRAVRARARASYVMSKLYGMGIAGVKVREGVMVTEAQNGQRGAVIRLIEDCFPKPAYECWDTDQNYKCDGDEDVNKDTECNVKDCQGNDGKAEIDITYDVVGQYVKYLGDPERDPFTGILLRANFPVSESLTLGLAAEYGKANEIGAAGFELDAEWDLNQWFKPRFNLIGRAYDLDTHLYFARGEIGGGVGFSGELAKYESWSFIYQVMGEWKYDVEWNRESWEQIKSGTGAFGVRF